MEMIKGGVTAAKGFKAAGVEAAIKYKNRKDMALVYSEVPAIVAGTFTTNVVKAAPVLWDMEIVNHQESAQAVVLNSGIANACTGEEGVFANKAMALAIADCLELPVTSVLTASTGVIGKQLPVDRITVGAKLLAENLSSSIEAGHQAALAIMTTDTICKECAVSFTYQGKTITVGAMSKGSGMIHPNMATMLAVVTSDISISKELLMKAVKADVKDTYNMISVDRDTSTNDSMLVLCNGFADNERITDENEGYQLFCEALKLVNTNLSKMMAKDGEGATKLLEVKAIHCNTKEEAIALSKSVITSNLVKTAVYGSDANWGRILCAMGYSGVDFDPYQVDVTVTGAVGTLKLVENGMATDYSEEFATMILKQEEVTAIIDMKNGEAEATAWGCDLTYDYVKINGDYRS